MKTVTGVFSDPEAALRAGERVREVAGRRATVRVFVPGADGSVIESAIVTDNSSYTQVPFIGVGLGLVVAVGMKVAGVGWGLSLMGFLIGLVTGGLLAMWLTGERYPRRVAYHEGDGRAVVTAIVKDDRHAATVMDVLRTSGAR